MVDCRYGKQDSRLACLCRSPKKPSRQSFIHREVNIRREDSSSTIRNDLPSVCLYKSTFIFDFLFFHPVFPLWFCSDMNGLCIILSNFDLFSFFFFVPLTLIQQRQERRRCSKRNQLWNYPWEWTWSCVRYYSICADREAHSSNGVQQGCKM